MEPLLIQGKAYSGEVYPITVEQNKKIISKLATKTFFLLINKILYENI